MSTAVPAGYPSRSLGHARARLRVGIRVASPRRTFQVTLGALWLLDAALQYQPYMFSRTFVDRTLASTAAGNPGVIADPITWTTNLLLPHIVIYNAVFATFQLLLALGLFWPRTVKPALAASIVWSIAVWWIGEGLGGVLTGGTSPFMGAPGAVILYAFIALLVWPRPNGASGTAGTSGVSVATSGPLGATVPRVLWYSLWASFIWFELQPGNRSPGSLGAMVSGMTDGEPQWLQSLDHSLGSVLTSFGSVVFVAFVVLCAVAGLAVFIPRFTKVGVTAAVIVGLVIWVAEDFGMIFTGKGTDPNSGLLIVLLAATFWPVGRSSTAAARG